LDVRPAAEVFCGERAATQKAELEEEQGGDEGAFAELEKVNKGSVSARVKEIKKERGKTKEEDGDELTVLDEWLGLNEEEGRLKREIKAAEADLDAAAYAQYPKLSVDEIKRLVVEDKWLATLAAALQAEMERISQHLTQGLKEVAERYQTPLPQMTEEVAALEKKVSRHLERMGFSWE
jgi:type I restriction enzyme M protein